jgi:hypothetical protein
MCEPRIFYWSTHISQSRGQSEGEQKSFRAKGGMTPVKS